MNNISIMGRICSNLEIKETKDGKKYLQTSIAVPRERQKDVTDFFPVTFWEKNAEFVQKYFGKGDMIAITGSMQSSTIEKDGKKTTYWNLFPRSVSFCGGKKKILWNLLQKMRNWKKQPRIYLGLTMT